MAKVQCYLSDETRDKITKLANQQAIPVSKYISHVLESHCADTNNNTVFQKKVMATLCDIYACVFNANARDTNHEAVLSRMQELKQLSEQAVNG